MNRMGRMGRGESRIWKISDFRWRGIAMWLRGADVWEGSLYAMVEHRRGGEKT